MAIPTIFATGAAVSSTGAIITPAIPTGTTTNDVLLLVHEMDPALNVAVLGAVTGYTDVLNSPVSQTTASLPSRLTVRWHRAAGAESGTVSVPAVTNHHVARIIGIRGCMSTGNPWNVSVSGLDNGTTTTATFPGVTTTVPDCLIINLLSTGTDIGSAQASGWANAGLANPSMAEVIDDYTLSGTGGGVAGGAGGMAAAGVVAATTATMTTGTVKALLTIAMRSDSLQPWMARRRTHPNRLR